MIFSRRKILISAAAGTLAAAASCAPAASNPTAVTPAATASAVNHQVEIKGFQFSPASLEVNAGDTITFTNLDIVPHTATANDKSWDTGNLGQNEAATITVQAGMMADYFCVYHPNMIASLTLS